MSSFFQHLIKTLRFFLIAGLLWKIGISPSSFSHAGEIDLSRAIVVAATDLSKSERKALILLVEEVQKRTLIKWEVTQSPPKGPVAAIMVGRVSSFKEAADRFIRKRGFQPGPRLPEGFLIFIEKEAAAAPTVYVLGNDARGVLFGAGRLLRELHMDRAKVSLEDNFAAATAPKYPLRGHQLGYRPKTNSYDGWNLPQWEQYIRDLAVFGTNAVELIPPRSDDDADSPHFPLPPMDMMVGMSRLLDDYGLDVWIWYPAMDRDYADERTVQFALQEWGEVFKKLPRIDAVLVPGGDPGHTPPKVLMAFLEKQTENLQRYHPRAQMWVSPQSFNKEWLDEFLAILHKDQPSWLTGVVYGPQVRVSLPQLRKAVPQKYPIRRYPDITHSLRCQYPVPDWDLAYALTAAREGINPRPLDEAHIFRAFQNEAIGFITYSEGCNDDVNKIIWSSLGWDPDAKIVDILRGYSRYFLGDRYTEDFARGLFALEKNWQGPLLTNEAVFTTWQQFRDLEKGAGPHDLLNWRFQQALYRAYYDAYQRSRLIYETNLEERALDKIRAAGRMGSNLAMNQAEEILDRAVTNAISPDWRSRVFELAEALFQSIRMQLSVERYKAIAVGRGATLDTIDVPLNNRLWLKQQFTWLRQLPGEAERLKGIDAIINWTNPGPGGFYDELGNPSRSPHLLRGPGYPKDPAFLQSSLIGFGYVPGWRMSWCRHAEALYDAPLQMRYADLDPSAQYRVRIVYAGDNFRPKIRLLANDTVEIHPWLAKENPVRPVEFDIPKSATAQGALNLTWFQEAGRGGNGRGCQVAEVWLIKK
ncbi:MAG TPA: hypothetical protein VGY77_02705 [Gemmataceae bacterium]|jgi:hypothetical protein|nr:hypothetical protein [Gemmataceae bacterium]